MYYSLDFYTSYHSLPTDLCWRRAWSHSPHDLNINVLRLKAWIIIPFPILSAAMIPVRTYIFPLGDRWRGPSHKCIATLFYTSITACQTISYKSRAVKRVRSCRSPHKGSPIHPYARSTTFPLPDRTCRSEPPELPLFGLEGVTGCSSHIVLASSSRLRRSSSLLFVPLRLFLQLPGSCRPNYDLIFLELIVSVRVACSASYSFSVASRFFCSSSSVFCKFSISCCCICIFFQLFTIIFMHLLRISCLTEHARHIAGCHNFLDCGCLFRIRT